jgi:hypothetical protein
VFFVEREALLARLEEETFAKFQQEMLYVIDDRRFKIRFRVFGPAL